MGKRIIRAKGRKNISESKDFSLDWYYPIDKSYLYYSNNTNIKVGDLLRFPTKILEVIEIFEGEKFQFFSNKYGNKIPDLDKCECFEKINLTTKQENNMEEKRNIQITLEQAKEWYKSDNDTLKKLALSAYTEKELDLSYGTILDNIAHKAITIFSPYGKNTQEKWDTLAELVIIAKYFNGDWKRDKTNNGYYLYKASNDSISVQYHYKGIISGVVYFKNREDAEKAIDILGDRIKYLFD